MKKNNRLDWRHNGDRYVIGMCRDAEPRDADDVRNPSHAPDQRPAS
jgi:hypothetical protein